MFPDFEGRYRLGRSAKSRFMVGKVVLCTVWFTYNLSGKGAIVVGISRSLDGMRPLWMWLPNACCSCVHVSLHGIWSLLPMLTWKLFTSQPCSCPCLLPLVGTYIIFIIVAAIILCPPNNWHKILYLLWWRVLLVLWLA